MRKVMNSLFGLSLLLFAVCGIAGFVGSAGAQECGIGIIKQAEGAGDLEFQFTTQSGDNFGDFTLTDGEETGGPFSPNDPFIIREVPTPGWLLADVECEVEGLVITDVQNGISIECVGPNTGGGECRFINVPAVSSIPTLSEWGMIAAAAGLAMIGVFFAVRRRAKAV